MSSVSVSSSSSSAASGRLVIIEGNISAGKSTLSHRLGAKLGYKVFLEPTSTNPYLEDFYKNPQKFAFPMQLWLLRQRFRTYLAAIAHIANTQEGAILDRSIFSDWVFAEKNRRDGTITQEAFEYYSALREKMLDKLPRPHVVIYLNVSPQVCFDRVHHMRGRECESGIPLAYLAGLDECYHEMLSSLGTNGSQVINIKWEEFGSDDEVIKLIDAAAVTHIPAEHVRYLRDLVRSPDAVRERLRLHRTREYNGVEDDERDIDVLIYDNIDADTAALFGQSLPAKKAIAAEPSTPRDEEASTRVIGDGSTPVVPMAVEVVDM